MSHNSALSTQESAPKLASNRLLGAAQAAARMLPALVVIFLLLSAALNYAGSMAGGLPAWAAALLDLLSSFSAVFLGIFIEAAPFLLLGTLGSGIVEVFLDRDDLAQWLPRRPLPGAVAGSLMGLFFPVCECGVVPFARRLMHKGVPAPVGIAALLAAPVLNPIVIASTLAAFGFGPVFWGRMALTLLIATLAGWFFALRSEANTPLRDAPVPAPLLVVPPAVKPPLKERLGRMGLVAADEFVEMGRYLVIGALLAALMQTFVPQSALLALGQGPLLSVIVMMTMAVLLSVCSTVDAFIALAFAGTFSTGALLAFLVFGPMVDIKSVLLYSRVFKPRAVAGLVLLPMLITLAVAVGLNLLGVQ